METKKQLKVFILMILSMSTFELGYTQQENVNNLQTEPKFIEKPPVTFPTEALGAGVTGKLWIKGQIGINGEPIKTEIIKREPDIAYMFDDAARSWFMKCRFSPARDSTGKAVKVWVSMPVSFKLFDFQPPVCERIAEAEYPEAALAMGMEGWVGVAILVSALGSGLNSRAIVVARDQPNSKVFDQAAIATAKASRYTAATERGKPIEGWCFVKVMFTIEDR